MANRNRAVVEILKLAYEFERSVARPGSEDWFVEATYEPTKLDQELLPDILDDQFDLVLITGNPGDGKSAFLGHLMSGTLTTRTGRQISVRHDATEPTDPEDRTASSIDDLVEFLGPLSDRSWEPERLSENCYVIGINKGLLVRAFLASNAPFSNLTDGVNEAINGSGRADEPLRIAVVDLNLRATVTPNLESRESLLDRILERIVGTQLWEDSGCNECEDSSWCPFYGNARRLRAGLPRERLKLIWLIQQLRSERHATIRDVLAGLAYILVGHEDMFRMGDDPTSEIEEPCAFVERERGADDCFALFRRVLYNAAFVEGDLYEGHVDLIAGYIPNSSERTYGMAPAIVSDYLVWLDPARRLSNSFWDEIEERILIRPDREADKIIESAEREGFGLEKEVYTRFRNALVQIAGELDEIEPSEPAYKELISKYHWICYLLVRTAKRRAFFYDVATTQDLTRFAALDEFLATLEYLENDRRDFIEEYENVLLGIIPAGLIQSEGIVLREERPHTIEVRWSQARERVGAVLVLPLTDPKLESEPNAVPYVETFPQRLVFYPGIGGGTQQKLTITLDTFEGLARLAQGYHEGFAGVPRTRQLTNFREALRVISPEEMVLLDFDEPANRVRVTRRERMRFD